jgi:hypothetical protein
MPQPEPPDRVPRFSIAGVMLLTVAIAIVLGVLQAAPRFTPLTAVLILAGWGALLIAQPDNKTALLICQLWAGLALPGSLIGLSIDNSKTKHPLLFLIAIVFWIGPFAAWSMIRYFYLPRTAALLSGWLAMTALNSGICALSFVFFGTNDVGHALNVEPPLMLGAFIAVVGIITAGVTAAVFHGHAMREAWRRSYRNPLAVLLVVLAPILMMVGIEFLTMHVLGQN